MNKNTAYDRNATTYARVIFHNFITLQLARKKRNASFSYFLRWIFL